MTTPFIYTWIIYVMILNKENINGLFFYLY